MALTEAPMRGLDIRGGRGLVRCKRKGSNPEQELKQYLLQRKILQSHVGPTWAVCQNDVALGYHHAQILVPNILSFIPDMAKAGLEPMLEQSILAVGGTGLAIAHRSTDAAELAQKQYGRALRLVAAALKDPDMARSDQTLVAVYLLSVFDSVEVRETWDSWANHVSGLLILLKLRREEGIHTDVADILFPALRVNAILYCFLNGTPIPDYILPPDDSDAAKESSVAYTGSPLDEMMRLISAWSTLRAHLRQNASTIDPQTAKTLLQNLEQRFKLWAFVTPSLHPAWACTIVPCDPDTKPEPWNQAHRSYHNPLFSKLWQLCFLARAFIVQGQTQCVIRSPDLFPAGTQLGLAVSFLDLTDESCATFPLPLKRDPGVLSVAQTSASSRISADMWTISVLATTIKDVMLLHERSELWTAPLEMRGLLSDAMKRNLRQRAFVQFSWLKRRLVYMKEEMGVRQAGTLAEGLSFDEP